MAINTPFHALVQGVKAFQPTPLAVVRKEFVRPRGRPRVANIDGTMPLTVTGRDRLGMPLTAQMREVLRWYAVSGKRQLEIADLMGIDIKTVEAHGASMRVRLGARNMAHAAMLALQTGQLTQDTGASPIRD